MSLKDYRYSVIGRKKNPSARRTEELWDHKDRNMFHSFWDLYCQAPSRCSVAIPHTDIIQTSFDRGGSGCPAPSMRTLALHPLTVNTRARSLCCFESNMRNVGNVSYIVK